MLKILMNRIKNNNFSYANPRPYCMIINITHLPVFTLLSFFILLGSVKNAHSQSVSSYSFYVAGHAYGAHAGKNIGLHPPFLEKLNQNKDTSVVALFLTGDIVNQSTTESWNQVEKELSGLNFNSYYAMGNHDNNPVGYEVFRKKHGGTYYSFIYKNELYVVLNSTESDRSISSVQLKFLDDIFANTDSPWERAFIFFHEVIWNSNEKYKLVRSNSRSRYAQIAKISNFWNEVYPKLTANPEKKFYLFAGDVGGNTDAIAATYDGWENVTLISSGMGEVIDENYLKVTVLPDTVTFELIPLNDSVEMKPMSWYNIPEKPDSIYGSTTVSPFQTDYTYYINPVPNTTSYKWNFSDGVSGSSDSALINLSFNEHFQTGKVSVTAVHDGFGESEPEELLVSANSSTYIPEKQDVMKVEIQQTPNYIIFKFNLNQPQNVEITVYDLFGRAVYKTRFYVKSGYYSKLIDSKNIDIKGFAIIEIQFGNKHVTKKITVN